MTKYLKLKPLTNLISLFFSETNSENSSPANTKKNEAKLLAMLKKQQRIHNLTFVWTTDSVEQVQNTWQ